MRARRRDYIEPLIVRPQQAEGVIGVGRDKIQEYMKSGEVEVVELGPNSRGITFASLKKLVDRLPRRDPE